MRYSSCKVDAAVCILLEAAVSLATQMSPEDATRLFLVLGELLPVYVFSSQSESVLDIGEQAFNLTKFHELTLQLYQIIRYLDRASQEAIAENIVYLFAKLLQGGQTAHVRGVVLKEMIPLLEWDFLGSALELLFMNSVPVTESICYILQCMQ